MRFWRRNFDRHVIQFPTSIAPDHFRYELIPTVHDQNVVANRYRRRVIGTAIEEPQNDSRKAKSINPVGPVAKTQILPDFISNRILSESIDSFTVVLEPIGFIRVTISNENDEVRSDLTCFR